MVRCPRALLDAAGAPRGGEMLCPSAVDRRVYLPLMCGSRRPGPTRQWEWEGASSLGFGPFGVLKKEVGMGSSLIDQIPLDSFKPSWKIWQDGEIVFSLLVLSFFIKEK